MNQIQNHFDGDWNKQFAENIQIILEEIDSPYVMKYTNIVFTNESENGESYGTFECVSDQFEGTLEDFIEEKTKDGKKMTNVEVMSILLKVYVGMNYLRNRSKYLQAHCLHPRNILVKEKIEDEKKVYDVKIMNYMTKICYKRFDDDMKMFMDPSLIHSLDLNGKIDHITSDLYSFALLVHLLLYGKLPFIENTTLKDIKEHNNNDYIKLSDEMAIEYQSNTLDDGKAVFFPYNDHTNLNTIAKNFIQMILTNSDKSIWRTMLSNPFIKEINHYSDVIGNHDQYTIQDFIGSGTFGNVYKVTDIDENIFAMKEILFAENCEEYSEKRKDLVQREHDSLKMCQHENIVKVNLVYVSEKRLIDYKIEISESEYEEFQLKNVKLREEANCRRKDRHELWNSNSITNIKKFFVYMVFDYCDLKSLKEFRERRRQLYKSNRNNIFRGIIKGYDYLYTKMGICHRDIKAENIMISMNPENENEVIVKIGDFGCSKPVNPENPMNTVVGTAEYLAPEVFDVMNKLEDHYTEQCDIFSLGILFYWMIEDYFPFGCHGNCHKFIQIYKNNTPIPFNKLARIKYCTLKEVISGMLKYNPKERLTWESFKRSDFFNYLKEEYPEMNNLNE